MDKALKQRLVGAIVLIILAVIVLPMLLGGRSETLKQESRQIEVPDIPDQLSIETRRFPVGIPNRPDVAPQDTPAPLQPPRPEAEPELAAGQLDSTAAAEPAAVADAVDNPEPATPAPGSGIESPPAVTAIKLGTGSDEPLAPALVGDEMEAPRYLVQVASFSGEKNANALAQRLRDQGLPVVMDVVARTAGRLHRVRVGPYTRRDDADAVVASLRADADLSDLAPRVLDLRPDDSAPVTTPSDPLVRWVVQVGSFNEPEHAEALVKTLRQDGLRAFSEQASTAAGTVYKVRIGPEISREKALDIARKVKQEHGLNDSFVMSSE